MQNYLFTPSKSPLPSSHHLPGLQKNTQLFRFFCCFQENFPTQKNQTSHTQHLRFGFASETRPPLSLLAESPPPPPPADICVEYMCIVSLKRITAPANQHTHTHTHARTHTQTQREENSARHLGAQHSGEKTKERTHVVRTHSCPLRHYRTYGAVPRGQQARRFRRVRRAGRQGTKARQKGESQPADRQARLRGM